MKRSYVLLGCVLCVAQSVGALAQTLAADSLYDDWDGIPLATLDPSGDASGVFDLASVYVTSRGTDLFLRFDIGVARNLIAGSGSDGDFRVDITHDSKLLRLDYRNRTVTWDGGSMSWVDIGARLHSTYASSEFELRVDMSSIGASTGDTISINFSGSDSLATSLSHTLSAPGVPQVRRDPAPHVDADFRIASLNTRSTGTQSGSRASTIARLLDGVDAEIYCLQEEYSSSVSDLESYLDTTDPLENGLPWNVVKNNDNAIATQHTILEVPSTDNSYAAALVDFGGGDSVLVLSIHPKCCGYIGSSEDTRRIDQATEMRATIDAFQSGSFGSPLDGYAGSPVIVVGDWNLVGSRTPLDIVMGADQQELLLRNLIGDDVITWRNDSSSFAPGRLDLLSHTGNDLFPLHSYVFDSERLDASELSLLAMLSDDSLASDHLMLVADFSFDAPPLSADLNGDGFVDGADLGLLLGQWGSAGATDLNSDGTTNGSDLGLLLAQWGAVP
ncbi:MAG: hypothetical protein ACF8GE_06135 [Phycisphaerales bacterium JB043]